jgi:CheY-like chemotaxis protein
MNKKSVLIVDDEPHVIRVLRLTLEREGYDVITANNGNEALAMLEQRLPDVVVTDLQMPQGGGRVLCETARCRYPANAFLILVMTSMTALEEREWVAQLENIEFLEKPLSPRRLVARLAACFGERAQMELQHA